MALCLFHQSIPKHFTLFFNCNKKLKLIKIVGDDSQEGEEEELEEEDVTDEDDIIDGDDIIDDEENDDVFETKSEAEERTRYLISNSMGSKVGHV